MTAVVRGDALRIPLRDESVDLIITSPPYFALRSYRDGGEHYDVQIGSEPTPQAFLEALWAVTAECWRVLKPEGSMFVNLGDKRSGSAAPGTTTGLTTLGGTPQQLRTGGPSSSSTLRGNGHIGGGPKAQRVPVQGERSGIAGGYTRAAFGRAKSKMLLPHRYAIGCEDGAADPDGMGWIVRQDLVWSKPNGLPESVRDRTRDAHEYWFHLTKRGDYFAAVDEIREPYKPGSAERCAAGFAGDARAAAGANAGHLRVDEGWGAGYDVNPRGALPRSVWEIATEPLRVPGWLGVDHFAAFPAEWPRRLILGWSPSGICTACGEGRVPVVEKELEHVNHSTMNGSKQSDGQARAMTNVKNIAREHATITGYACACPDDTASARPAVVLDPFGGTGTTAMVARALGRTGISLDLSADYCRLAAWRIFQSGHGAKAIARTNGERQGVLL